MAVPAFVGASDGRNGTPEGTSSLTLPIPAGSAGDLLVAVVGVKVNPSTTTPSGWTPIIAGFNGCTCASHPNEGIRCQLSAWWKIAAASDTSVTFSFGPQVIRQASGGVLRYSGVDAADPVNASGCDKGSSAAPTAPSVTTTRADTRVLRLAVTDADDAKSKFTSEPATQRFEIESTTVFGPGSSYTGDAVVTAASDAAQAAAGPTGTAGWALPSTDQWAAMTVAIQPPAGGGGEPNGCVAILIKILKLILQGLILAIKRLIALLKKLLRRRRGRTEADS